MWVNLNTVDEQRVCCFCIHSRRVYPTEDNIHLSCNLHMLPVEENPPNERTWSGYKIVLTGLAWVTSFMKLVEFGSVKAPRKMADFYSNEFSPCREREIRKCVTETLHQVSMFFLHERTGNDLRKLINKYTNEKQ